MATAIRYGGAQLYPKQRAAIYDPARISLIEASTKAGKSVGCLAWLLEKALLEGKPERNYWWVAPVFAQAGIGYRRMKAKIPKAYVKPNESALTLKLINGTTIWFKSADRPDDLYGEDVYAAVLDEASRMREEAWHAIRSTLTATKGPVRIIGNVRGQKNWFYRLCRLAESGAEGMAFHRITAWDAVEAGVLDRAEIESAHRDFVRLGQEGVFRQLYMAEAVDDSDNPFGIEAIRRCLIDELVVGTEVDGTFNWRNPADLRAFAGGVDLAGRGAVNLNTTGELSDRDYTAIVTLDRDGTTTSMSRFRKPHTETEAAIVKALGRTPSLVDSTGTGDAVVERLQRRGDMRVEGYTFTERSRQDLLEGLALVIGEEGVHFPDGPLRAELESFEFRYTRTGVKFSVPEGHHDDITFALALGVRKLPRRRKASEVPVGVGSENGSKWTGNAGDDAWRRYQEGLKPTQLGAADGEGRTGDPSEEPTVAVPIAVQGPTSGRWTRAG